MYITSEDFEKYPSETYGVIRYYIDAFPGNHSYPRIFESAKSYVEKRGEFNQNVPINYGFYSASQAFIYLSTLESGSFNHVLASKVIADMEYHEILISYGAIMLEMLSLVGKPLRLGDYGKRLSKWGTILIKNKLIGFSEIAKVYRNSVVKIELEVNGEVVGIGTGFCITTHLISDGQRKIYIVTNNHVVEEATRLNLYTNEDQPIRHVNQYLDPHNDIAFLEVEEFNLPPPFFILKPEIEILSEIITIGYPSIPFTRDAYQVAHKGQINNETLEKSFIDNLQLAHKGEINSMVKDYPGNNFFLISAKTSSGNSGSPVINDEGCVVGMLTQELFNQDDYIKKGKPPYYAAIPAQQIINSFTSLINTPEVITLQVF
ncbi:serine protease [Mucilaginibacter angelicae]|uniref:Serine protease n=1 Tax=Mucilaginibacter angelicae TaxID=869718 RepID=A0ABV6L3D2_9SPHI